MKMKMEMGKRLHKYDINSLKFRHGHEYSTYKVSLYEYA